MVCCCVQITEAAMDEEEDTEQWQERILELTRVTKVCRHHAGCSRSAQWMLIPQC